MMMKMKKSTNRKFLTTAVMCSLLAMGSSSAWAATPKTTTTTVTSGNTVDTPYSAITVTNGGAAISSSDPGFTVYLTNGATVSTKATQGGIVNNSAGTTLTVQGNMQLDVALDAGSARKNTNGIMVEASGAASTITVDQVTATITANGYNAAFGGYSGGILNAAGGSWTVTSTGGTITSANASVKNSAFGFAVSNKGKLNLTDKATLNITATGAKTSDSGTVAVANADARGIANSNITTAKDLDITVKSTTGPVAADGTNNVDISALAFGLWQFFLPSSPITLSAGQVTANLTAAAGTISNAGSGSYVATATISGVANGSSIVGGTVAMTLDSLQINGTAMGGTATGGVATSDAHAEAYGIQNESIFADNVTVDVKGAVVANLTATGGVANSDAHAEAYGIKNYALTGTAGISAGSLDLTVTANNGKATSPTGRFDTKAIGLDNSISDGTGTAQVTVTGLTTINATAKATDTSLANSLTANGLKNKGGTLDVQDVAATVSALDGNTDTHATGIYNYGTVTAKTLNMTVTATGSQIPLDNSSYSNDTMAYGITNESGSLTATGATLTVTANGGGSGDNGSSNVMACGVSSGGDDTTVMTLNGPLNLKVTANGGTTSATGYLSAEAYGISTFGEAALKLQDVSGTVTANINVTGASSYNYVLAEGFVSYSDITVADVDLTVNAANKLAANDNGIEAFGLDAEDGSKIQVNGKALIKTGVTTSGSDREYFKANSLLASGDESTLNVGTDGAQSLGKQVQLEGDVQVYNGGVINLTLDGPESYLQGNVQTTATSTNTGNTYTAGTVNMTVTGGATWKPVYDNRYGSLNKVEATDIDSGTTSTYDTKAQSYAFANNSIGTLTLSNGGKVDLTWDNATRDPAAAGRTLTIGTLSGDGGIFKVNTNLAKNVADEITITNNTATNLGIDVAYDPALTASGLDNNSNISGNAKVLTISSGTTPTVTGVSDSYNTYDYTPTITNNGDGTYSVTKLTITNKTPTEPTNPTDNSTTPTKTTVTSPSSPMRDARHQRMALHNLWVNGELNNMEKRLGDLRAVEPAESGIWARYEYNKLEKGRNANLKYNYFQLGYDKDFKGDTGNFYRGVAFSYGKGDGSYEVGTGDLKEGAMTLYQTWVGKSGNYYDIVAKAGKLLNDYNAVNTANPYTSDYHSWAYSIGGEVGKRFKKDNGFFVEPQFEFTLGRITGADYTTSTGMKVNVDAQNSAVARIGVAVGKESKNVGSYYAKASYFHDFGGGLNLTASDSTTNPFSYSEDSAKNWCIFTLGGAVKASKNCNVFGELSKYTGELSNNIQVNVGARWSF